LALVVGAAGAASLPLDDHEVFVVQSAQEMRERRDWIVPHFFGEPRLTKPPLSYWLAAGLAEAVGTPRVTAWQGRTASIAAGVGVVVLTMVIALALADGSVAAAAGLIAVSSVGFFRYTHSARPDMLYAFWCTLMVAAVACGWRAWVLWVAAGLATLTKGPQVPAMLLAALVLVEWRHGTSPRTLARRWRPLSGLGVALALTVPWWWAVQRALGDRGLAGTQLAGSLLAPSWADVLDPYYLYRPLALVLPSALILLVALVRRRWPREPRDAMRWLAALVVVPALAFTFGPQRRPHYMLPALAPMCILLALVAGAALAAPREGTRARWLPGAALVACLVTAAVAVTGAGTTLLWSRDRFVTAELAGLAGRALPAPVPLFTLGVGGGAFSYYAGRPMREARTLTGLLTALERTPDRRAGVIARRGLLEEIPPALNARVLAERVVNARRELVLVELASGGSDRSRLGEGIDARIAVPGVLDPPGDLLGRVHAQPAGHELQRHVDARRHAGRRPELAVLHPAGASDPLDLRSLRHHPVPRALVGRGAVPVEDAGAREERRARADRRDVGGERRALAQPRQHLRVLDLAARADAAGHEQRVERRCVCAAVIRQRARSLGAGDRTAFGPDEQDLEVFAEKAQHLERAEHVEQLEVGEQHDAQYERPVCHARL
jgi:hypothetical protein